MLDNMQISEDNKDSFDSIISGLRMRTNEGKGNHQNQVKSTNLYY